MPRLRINRGLVNINLMFALFVQVFLNGDVGSQQSVIHNCVVHHTCSCVLIFNPRVLNSVCKCLVLVFVLHVSKLFDYQLLVMHIEFLLLDFDCIFTFVGLDLLALVNHMSLFISFWTDCFLLYCQSRMSKYRTIKRILN